MKNKDLYIKMETDFELSKCSDDWSQMDFNEYIDDNFKKRYMGLVLDNAEQVKKVYTAVFPSDKVLNEILAKGEKDVLLFTHHPMTWDTKVEGFPFKNINSELLPKLKENRIALYNLHVPLDKNGEYSTSVNLARAIGVSYDEDFAKYYGVWAGVVGKSDCQTLKELAEKTAKAIGHEVGILQNGEENIFGQKIAVVGGGGNDLDILAELLEKGIKTFVTGVIRVAGGYPPAIEFKKLVKENHINVIAGTHYSTEKFACIKVVDYFKNLGLEAEFIDDEPDFGDLD